MADLTMQLSSYTPAFNNVLKVPEIDTSSYKDTLLNLALKDTNNKFGFFDSLMDQNKQSFQKSMSESTAITPDKIKQWMKVDPKPTPKKMDPAFTSAIASGMNTIGSGLSSMSGAYNGTYGGLAQGINSGITAAGQFAGQFVPAVGLAVGVGNMFNGLSNSILGSLDNVNKTDAIMSSIPGLGGIYSMFGKTSDTFSMDNSTRSAIGSSYGDTYSTLDDASKLSGKKMVAGLGSANRKIATANELQGNLQNINAENNQRLDLLEAGSKYKRLNRDFNMTGGYDQRYSATFKEGGKIETIEELYSDFIKELSIPKKQKGGTIIKEVVVPAIVKEVVIPSIDDIIEYKAGGQFNVIPEGALHARKHNMDIDNITKKGIPVVSESEGGELTQQAEIERNEVILRLEVTEKIEELYKEYSNEETKKSRKDELALEAGKLLTNEILYNTQDNTGILNE